MKILWIPVIAMICLPTFGEMRTWTNTKGKTFEGEYISTLFDDVKIKNAEGEELRIPLASLSETDKKYVELQNPPQLKVEYRKSEPVKEYTAEDWYSNSGGQTRNHPIKITTATFGAEVIQKSTQAYNHALTVEVYALTKELYDPSKYHLIVHSKSASFKLTKENDRRFAYEDKKTYKILSYNLYDVFPRGETLGEYLVLVRDERGKVIAHNGTKKWLYNNLDKLNALPVGAWLNDKCVRVHPTSPKWTE